MDPARNTTLSARGFASVALMATLMATSTICTIYTTNTTYISADPLGVERVGHALDAGCAVGVLSCSPCKAYIYMYVQKTNTNQTTLEALSRHLCLSHVIILYRVSMTA